MKIWLRISLTLTILLAILLTAVPTVHASVFDEDGTVEAGEIIDDDLFLSGESVEMAGTVNGLLFAGGDTVVITGVVNGDAILFGREVIIAEGATVDGNLFSGAQTVTIQGTVNGSLFGGSASMLLADGAVVERNTYYGGYSFETAGSSLVERDLYVGGYQALLAGEVGRNAAFGGVALDVTGKIGQNLTIDIGNAAESNAVFMPNLGPEVALPAARQPGIRIDDGATIGNRVLYTSTTRLDDTIEVEPSGGVVFQTPVPGTTGVDTPPTRQPITVRFPVLGWLFDFARQMVTLLAFGALVLWLAPILFDRAADQARTNPLPAAGYGVLTIFGGYFSAFVAVGLILALALLFGVLTLGGLSSPVLGIGFSGLGLFVTVFTLLVSTGSKLIVAYMIGQLLVDRLAPQTPNRAIWALISGVVLFVLVTTVPFVGWLIGLVATLIGVGALWLVYQASRQSSGQTQAMTPTQPEA
jgi:hypothetical protein